MKNVFGSSLWVSVSIVLISVVSPAHAVPIVTANVDMVIGSNTSNDNNSATPGAVSANLQSGSGPFNNLVTGTAAANDQGQLGVTAAFSGSNARLASVASTASWVETFTGGNSDTFDFVIPSAVIGFDANNSGRGSQAFLDVSISLNNVSIFNSSTSVTQLNPILSFGTTAADFSVVEAGTSLNPVFNSSINTNVNIFGDSAGFQFSGFVGSLILNSNIGVSNTLTYEMTTRVAGRLGEASLIASVGDPLNLSQLAPVVLNASTAPPVAVSTPGALVLFLTGLVVMAVVRKRP